MFLEYSGVRYTLGKVLQSEEQAGEETDREERLLRLNTWNNVILSQDLEEGLLSVFINGTLHVQVQNEALKRTSGKVHMARTPLEFHASKDTAALLAFLECNQIAFPLESGLIESQLFSLDEQHYLFVQQVLRAYPTRKSHPDIHPIEMRPLHSMHELRHWTPGKDPLNCSTVPLRPRPPQPSTQPKVLHCHDFKGGYQHDRYTQGTSLTNPYNFQYWQLIDYFIYFSHCRVTIPPHHWTDVAHKNGVLSLGTYIVEWDEGMPEILEFIQGPQDELQNSTQPYSTFYADKLIALCDEYGFDGWLFNVECKVEDPSKVRHLLSILQYMRQQLNQRGKILIWYDSLTVEGALKWQNTLNSLNRPFFDVCDAIFVNYHYTAELLKAAAMEAGVRKCDVFMGVDVFGRGTYGGGKWNTHVAMEKIVSCGMSVALFAPGWTHEQLPTPSGPLFEKNERRLWLGDAQINVLNESQDNPLKSWTITASGGDGWKVLPQKGFSGGNAFQTSFAICAKKQRVDLYSAGEDICSLQRLLAQRIQIECSDWICGASPKYNDTYEMHLKLLDANGSTLEEYCPGPVVCSSEWQRIHHRFIIGKGTPHENVAVRYVEFEHAGKDAEYWAGHFGSIISDSEVCIFSKVPAVGTFIPVRPIPLQLPFETCFSPGEGRSIFQKGSLIKSTNYWFQLSTQDVLPSWYNVIHEAESDTDAVEFHRCNSVAWNGPCSLQFQGHFTPSIHKHKSVTFRLFKTKHVIQPGTILQYVTLHPLQGNAPEESQRNLDEDMDIILCFADNTRVTTPRIFASDTEAGMFVRVEHENKWRRKTVRLQPELYGRELTEICCTCYSGRQNRVKYNVHLGALSMWVESQDDVRALQQAYKPNMQHHFVWNSKSIETGKEIYDIHFEWDPYPANHLICYSLLMNGALVGTTRHTEYRIEGITLEEQPLFSLEVALGPLHVVRELGVFKVE